MDDTTIEAMRAAARRRIAEQVGHESSAKAALRGLPPSRPVSGDCQCQASAEVAREDEREGGAMSHAPQLDWFESVGAFGDPDRLLIREQIAAIRGQEPQHPHRPRTFKPGVAVLRHLYQSRLWTTNDGDVLEIKEMTTEHLFAVAGYLRWYAKRLYRLDPTPKGTLTISAWLEGLPLWTRVENELWGRASAAPDGFRIGDLGDSTLLAFLRRQGPVPWETKTRKRRSSTREVHDGPLVG